MKNFLISLCCHTALLVNFQDAQAQTQPSKTQTPTISLFQPAGKAARSAINLNEHITNYTLLTPDMMAWQQLMQERPASLSLTIPFEGGMTLELEQSNPLAPDFILTASNAAGGTDTLDFQPGLHYSGKIAGMAHSLVAISIFDDQIMGVISDEESNINLGRINTDAARAENAYVIYRDEYLVNPPAISCDTKDNDSLEIPVESLSRALNACPKITKFYLECAYKMYQDNGNSTTNTTNFTTALFNVVATLYQNEQVTIQISQIYVWTTPDSYPLTSSGDAKAAFEAARPNYNGDFAHLLTTAPAGLGGLANWWTPFSCAATYAFCNIANSYSPLPTYSWSVNVMSHESGHNFGSQHTHWCGWTGGALDDCYATEGGCAPGPHPSNGGTIMSYCHLIGTGINFSNGFGIQPGNLIRSRIDGATCLYQPPGPQANFTSSINDLIVSFTNTSSNATLYAWDFGDNETSTQTNTSHTYASPGTYNVCLTATGSCGTNTACHSINITPACNQTDSLALVALYNATNGPNWTNHTNWLVPGMPIGTWHGVTTNVQGCLVHLVLNDNQLSGSIPPELGELKNLEVLHLYRNQLNGSIPPELSNLENILELYLFQNQLDGSIPPELGNLENLYWLALNNNQLSGGIPPELGNLEKLDGLWLHQNQLSGCFPSSFTALCGISYYNFNNNPLLPWQGDFSHFCIGEPQIGASCDDGDATTLGDVIQADCSCGTKNCPPQGLPAPGGDCASAPLICGGIDGYCNTLDSVFQQAPFLGCPANVLNNDAWIGFVASTPFISIQVTPSNCHGGTQPGLAGMQGGIYGSCTSAIALHCSGTTEPFVLQSSNFIVGNTYYLMIDGYADAICDYKVDVLQGSTAALSGELPDAVLCAGDNIAPSISGNAIPYTFIWSSGETTPVIVPANSGIYAVTVTDAIGCQWDTSVIVDILPADSSVCNSICSTQTCTTPVAAYDAPSACILPSPDALDCYFGQTINNPPISLPPFWCTSVENNQWFAFAATDTTASFVIEALTCDTGGAIQAALLETTDCNTFSFVSDCLGNIPSGSAQTLANNVPLVPGKVYYLMIDGSAGALCNYTINASSSITSGSQKVCIPSTTTYSYTTTKPCEWHIAPSGAGVFVGGSTGTEVQIEWLMPGTASICAQSINCPNIPPFCLEVTIGEAIEATHTHYLCAGSSIYCAGQTYTQPGLYQANVPSPSGCDSLITCIVIPVAPINDTLSPVVLCGPANYQLCNDFYSFSGFYSSTCTGWQGCDSTVSVNLTILEPDAYITPFNPVLGCGPDSTLFLDGSGSNLAIPPATWSMLWTGPGIVGPNNQILCKVNQPGQYCLRVTHSLGSFTCFDETCINVSPKPPTSAGTMDLTPITVCSNQAATATYDSSGEFLDQDDTRVFYLHEGNGNTLVNPITFSNTPTFSFQPGMSYGTTYYISAVVGNADWPDPIDLADPCLSVSVGTPVVFLSELFEATLSAAPDTSCAGAPVMLTASGGGTYTWSNGLGTTPAVTATPASTTTYTVTVTNAQMCMGTVSATVVVNTLPTVDLGADIVLQQGQDTVLDATGAGLSYKWSTGATTPAIEVTTMGTYSVTVTNSFGCTATDEVVVSVMTSVEGRDNQYKITVSPNPTKDMIYIVCEGGPISSIELIDNLGRLILEDNLYTPEGVVRTLQLAKLSDGAYHLKVTVKDFVKTITVLKQ